MTLPGLDCPVCGQPLQARGQQPCGTCPLAPGCRFLCCPSCGYQTIDPRQGLVAKWLTGRGRRLGRRRGQMGWAGGRSLLDVPAGWTARVAAVDAEPIGRRQQLLAYGLEASAHIRVIQQRPVVVLTIGETEVALEPDLAGLVEVDSIAPVG